MTIRTATADDRPALHTLLTRSRLPLDGFDEHLARTVVAEDAGRVVGCAAIERHGACALLRSVAVDEALRGQGLGQRLTAEALAIARREGLTGVYLLTETASGFFPRLGFLPVTRDEVPEEVRQSVEFTTACPASAQAMRLQL
jgi:amino-acid N-acetyltransferase